MSRSTLTAPPLLKTMLNILGGSSGRIFRHSSFVTVLETVNLPSQLRSLTITAVKGSLINRSIYRILIPLTYQTCYRLYCRCVDNTYSRNTRLLLPAQHL